MKKQGLSNPVGPKCYVLILQSSHTEIIPYLYISLEVGNIKLFTVAEPIFDGIFFFAELPCVKSAAFCVIMYAGSGGMGGGGNAWMKIMGIDQDKVKARHLQAEKEAKIKAKEGKGGSAGKDDIDCGGEAVGER